MYDALPIGYGKGFFTSQNNFKLNEGGVSKCSVGDPTSHLSQAN